MKGYAFGVTAEYLKASVWPSERAFPTPTQFEAARARYDAANALAHQETGHVDTTDWVCGLEFVMATYTPALWLGFFFPEEAAAFKVSTA